VNLTIRLLCVPTGKLATKVEAAGKVRVFAMVDCWTNWILHPIHKLIFEVILVKLPQDGTFNQMKPVWLLLKNKTKGL
jgi:hypothetical protein